MGWSFDLRGAIQKEIEKQVKEMFMSEVYTYNTNSAGEPVEVNMKDHEYKEFTSGYIDAEPRKTPAWNMGWICPVCGRGLSPYTTVCPCKLTRGIETTC